MGMLKGWVKKIMGKKKKRDGETSENVPLVRNTLFSLLSQRKMFTTSSTKENKISVTSHSLVRKASQSTQGQRFKYLSTLGYRVIQDVDNGAFAQVYLANNIQTKRFKVQTPVLNVAIKRVNRSATGNRKFLTKFLPRELAVHTRIHHKNVVAFYETLWNEHDCYMVLEWVPRGNLLDYCRLHGRLPESTACTILVQLCDALTYLHLNHIVHRDIKCENLLIADLDPLFIKVADFGFAKFIGCHKLYNPPPGYDLDTTMKHIDTLPNIKSEDTIRRLPSISSTQSELKEKEKDLLTTTFCGSLAYSAPELIMGKAYDGRKVDSWAVGCVLFICLAHKMAFREKHGNKKLLDQHIVGPVWPSSSEKLSETTKNCVEKILKFDVKDRPFVDEILRHRWVVTTRNSMRNIPKKKSDESNRSRDRRRSVSEPNIEIIQQAVNGSANRQPKMIRNNGE